MANCFKYLLLTLAGNEKNTLAELGEGGGVNLVLKLPSVKCLGCSC